MARTVELLETGEYSTMVSTWRDHVYLTRRADGTFTLKLHRRPIGDPGYAFLYRSRPFRTPRAFLDALKKAEPESSFESFGEDLDTMLDAAAQLDRKLASSARTLLAQCPWDDWDPDAAESHIVPTVRLDAD